MKKKALKKDFYMEIKKSLGRFLSILFIVALGVSFFAGIRASEPDMRMSGDAYFDEHNLADMKVVSTMGLTDSDRKAIEETKGVKKVESAYGMDAMCQAGDRKKVVHILSELPSMNEAEVDQGRMPKAEDECFLDIDFMKSSGYEIGDEIHLESGTEEELTDSLKCDTFTIVGAGSSPCYISFERGSSMIGTGEVGGFMIVPPESFSMDVYTELYMTVDGAFDETAFTKDYDGLIDKVEDRVDGMKEARQQARRDEIVSDAEEELAEAEIELNDAKTELANAKQELIDGRQKMEDGKRELADAKREAEAELTDARKKLTDGERALASGKQELSDGKKELVAAKSALAEKQTELEQAAAQYEDGWAKLTAGKEELAAQEAALAEQKATLEGAVEQLRRGMKEAEQGIGILSEKIDETTAGISEVQTNYAQAEHDYDVVVGKLNQNPPIEDPNELAQLEAKKAELEQLLAGLKKKEEELKSGLSQLETEKEKAAEMLANLQEQLKQAEDGLQNIVAGEAKLAGLKEELARNEQTLLAMNDQIVTGKSQIESGWGALTANESMLSEAEQTIAASEKELASGWAEYESGKREADAKIAAGEQEILAGEQELEEGEAKVADGEREIADGELELADAKEEIAKIGMPKWYIYDRDVFEQYSGYGDNADRMRAIGQVFPVLFFLVAALISLTTMTRMVEEQRTQIGTLKALGYSKTSIAWKYLGYALAATLTGSVIGVLVGEKLYPYIIVTAYKIMYPHLPNVVIPYNLKYAVMATAAAVVCTLAATVFACYKEMAAHPAVLMRPPSPKEGKRILLERITFIWKRLNFTWKSTLRNLIRYKKRFFMTVFGIGGCMALILVGYGLRDSIFNIAIIQYEDIQKYNMMAILDEDASKEETDSLNDYIKNEEGLSDTLDIYMKNMTVGKGKTDGSAYIFVPSEGEKFEKFVNLQNRRTKQSYELSEDGAVLTEKMARELSVEAGDTIYVKDEEENRREVKITAVCENYMGHYLYMTKEAYESVFGEQPNYNTKLLKTHTKHEKDAQKMGEEMLATKAAINVQYMDNMRGQIEDMLSTLDQVIVVLITAAGMLAFVVLYNLNNINITERRRELATIKVLGFYDLEVAEYVYRENILLTIIGAIAGCGLGYLLHQFVIVTVEVDDVMFGRNIEPKSYLIAILFTFAFSAFVNFVMYFKLKRIDMVESLKSVE